MGGRTKHELDAKEEGKRKKRGSSEGEERATTHWNERRLK